VYKGKTILFIIPARGGSKDLPNKNIKLLLRKPLVAWTIGQAKNSKYVDRIVVSTDDKKIVDISKRYGLELPFIRPKKLATDKAKMIDVIMHALEWLKNKGQKFDIVALLQPTSPLRTSRDIDYSIEMLFRKNCRAVISVCKAEHHPLWSNTLEPDHSMKNFLRENINNKSRQELPKYYRLNGAIYLAFYKYLKQNKGFFGKNTLAYIMPRERSVDIDNILDFWLAEAIIKRRK